MVTEQLAPGATAPNFDLASTEDAVLMLCDEVPRMSVVLYFFADPKAKRSQRDLEQLASAQTRLAENRAVVLAISRSKLPALKEMQRELGLRFPLLHDDRDFSARYGIETPAEGEPEPALFLVDRDQKIVWLERPVADLTTALDQVVAALEKQPPPTYHYPSKVVNRVVDWWVNKVRPRPAA